MFLVVLATLATICFELHVVAVCVCAFVHWKLNSCTCFNLLSLQCLLSLLQLRSLCCENEANAVNVIVLLSISGLTYFLTTSQRDEGSPSLIENYLQQCPDCEHILGPLGWGRERRTHDVVSGVFQFVTCASAS